MTQTLHLPYASPFDTVVGENGIAMNREKIPTWHARPQSSNAAVDDEQGEGKHEMSPKPQ